MPILLLLFHQGTLAYSRIWFVVDDMQCSSIKGFLSSSFPFSEIRGFQVPKKPFLLERMSTEWIFHYSPSSEPLHCYLDVKPRFMYQIRPSKLHQLPFDQGVQIVITPRSPASVPEPIGTPWQYFASIWITWFCCLLRQSIHTLQVKDMKYILKRLQKFQIVELQNSKMNHCNHNNIVVFIFTSFPLDQSLNIAVLITHTFT